MFLDGSYPAHGMLSVVLALWALSACLSSRRFVVLLIIPTALAWVVVSDLIGENSISILPAFLFLVFTAACSIPKKIALTATLGAISYLRLEKYFATAGVNPSNQAVSHTPEVMLERIRNAFEWWLPVTVPAAAAYAFIIAVGFGVCWSVVSGLKNREHWLRPVVFYALWFGGTCAPFWFLSKYFGVRYFYIPFFALSTLVLIIVWRAAGTWLRDRAAITAVLCLAVMSVYCVQRYRQNVDAIERWNRKHDAIYQLASPHLKVPGTQFVMANLGNLTGGYYVWSSGYLMRLLDDTSVRGVMGHEKNFYDPFNLDHCSYRYTMSCMRLDRPVVGIYGALGGKRRKMNYFLRWFEKDEGEPNWHLLKADDEDRLSILAVGSGMEAYRATLDRFAIDADDVLFGNLAKYKPTL